MEVIRKLHGFPNSMYDCSGRSAQEWETRGEKWPVIGSVLIGLGFFYIFLYILSLYAIFQLGLTKHSCYRIMVVLVFIDVMNLFNNSLTCGYLAMIGGVFCTNPFWMFLHGTSNFFCWSSACFLYVLLGLNRAFCVLEIRKFDWFFANYYGAFWIVLMLLYASFCGLYHTPLPFNSKLFLGTFIPMIEDDFGKELRLYENPTFWFTNYFTSVFLFLCYGLISVNICMQKNFVTSASENKILLQAALITVPTQFASTVYTIMQYSSSPTNVIINIIGHFGWQIASGIAGVVYLTINTQIRTFLMSEWRRLRCIRRFYGAGKVTPPKVHISNPEHNPNNEP